MSNKKKLKFPNSSHPVDHMRYMLFLNEIMKSENHEIKNDFFEPFNYSNFKGNDQGIMNNSAFMVEMHKYFDQFTSSNLTAQGLIDDKVMDFDSSNLLVGMGFDLDLVSPEFVEDLNVICAYQEVFGDNNNKIGEFLRKNRSKILELSGKTHNRDIFKGLTFGLIHNKNIQKTSVFNQETGKVSTPFLGFDFNTREMAKTNTVNQLLKKVEQDFQVKNNIQPVVFDSTESESITRNIAEDISGPHVADYMKYILMLNELQKDENQKMFDRYVQALLSERGYEDASELTVEQLISLDFDKNLIPERLSVISNHVPELREKVDTYIDSFDASQPLTTAGYNVDELPGHFIDDVKTTMAYEATFPDPLKSHISERLASIKDAVLTKLSSDNSRMALSATMMAVACTVGGPFAIALSGANMASNFLKSDKVVDILNRGQQKLNDTLISLGLKKETLQAKEDMVGTKLKSFFENKWVQNGLKVAGIGALAFGVATVAAPYIEDGTLADFASNALDSAGSNLEIAGDAASQLMDDFGDFAAQNLEKLSGLTKEMMSGVESYVGTDGENIIGGGELLAGDIEDAMTDYFGEGGEKIIAGGELLAGDLNAAATDYFGKDGEKIIEGGKSLYADAKSLVGLGEENVIGSQQESVASNFDKSFGESIEMDYEDEGYCDLDGPVNNAGGAPNTPIESQQQSMASNFDKSFGESTELDFEDEDYYDADNAEDAIQYQDYSVKGSDTSLWQIAERELVAANGGTATPQQIAQLIDDLGLDNPNHIVPGQVIPFPADLSAYKDVTSIKPMDWLVDVPESTVTPESAEVAESMASDFNQIEKIDISKDFNIQDILSATGSTANLAEISNLNQEIDLFNLSPGDKMDIPTEAGTIEFVIPEIDDVILSKAFPDGIPEFLDTDKYIDLVKDMNPSVDLSTGIFGNGNIGNDILRAGELTLPEFNASDIKPQDRTFILEGTASHSREAINDTLLNAAYPNGVPELVNEKAVLNDIKATNPELKSIMRSDRSFEELVKIGDGSPSIQSAEAPSATSTNADKTAQTQQSINKAVENTKLFGEGNKENFMDRLKYAHDHSDDFAI